MRSLIRPTLFLIARLGLFLAVVAWVVGQWWYVSLVTKFPVSDGKLAINACYHGFAFMKVGVNRWNLNVWVLDELSTAIVDNFFLLDVARPNDWAINVTGISYRQAGWRSTLVIRHWLVVTVFALFYAVLKLIYRQRPEDQPCET